MDELGRNRVYYGTHSICKTKATVIYRQTKNLSAMQLPSGNCIPPEQLRLPVSNDD